MLILESLDQIVSVVTEQLVEEMRAKKKMVLRTNDEGQREKVVKMVCPDGYMYSRSLKKCRRITATESRKYALIAKRRGKALSRNKAALKMAARKRMKTNKRAGTIGKQLYKVKSA
jgi:hypothetical protein